MPDHTLPPRVLYVGPQTDKRNQHLATLRSSDITVQVTATAMAALKQLDDLAVDCLVVSGQLQDMDINQFHRKVTERQPAVSALVVGPFNPEPSENRGPTTPVKYVPNGENLAETVTSVVEDGRIDAALDDHRQLKGTIYRIARDVIDASSRKTIDRHIYTQFIDHDRYQFVWPVEYDDATETLHLRVPTTGEFTAEEFAALVGTDDPSFLTRAITNRDVEVADGSVTTRSSTANLPQNNAGNRTGDTRTPPTTVAVVPFIHSDTIHGLLLLVTTQSATIDEAEQDLLADLGRIIGYKLTRIQFEESAEPSDPEAFASMVVHELTNPLNVAQGNLEMAQGGETDRLDAVDRALDQMEHVLMDELGLFRGQDIEAMADCELADAAREAWASIVTDDAEYLIDDSALVHADQVLLVRLLANLFDNTVTHGGEEVIVRVGMLESEPGFYVEDDGQGIPDDEQGRIFEQGYTTRGGTGLGLAIVQRIVDAHVWDITVTDGQGGGARFEITGIELSD